MSKKDEDDLVTEKLCEARRQTIQEQISGIKKTIYVTSAAITIVIVIVQFVLTFWR